MHIIAHTYHPPLPPPDTPLHAPFSMYCSQLLSPYRDKMLIFLYFPHMLEVQTKLILCIMEEERMPVGCDGAMAENTSQCGVFELSL